MAEEQKLFAIIAIDSDLGIGYKNNILFHNNIDMYVFKTYSNLINDCIVGRVTFEDLPTIIQKTRKLHVVTTNDLHNSNINVINNINKLEDKNYLVIGGSKIYKLFADKISTWVISTHKALAIDVDAWFDRDLYESIKSTCNSITLYEDEDIIINVYIRK